MSKIKQWILLAGLLLSVAAHADYRVGVSVRDLSPSADMIASGELYLAVMAYGHSAAQPKEFMTQ